MEHNYAPYTYFIGWSKLNKWYYGVEYGVKKTPFANPINLWKSYFTSSNIVLYFRRTYGEPDVVEVRKTFSNGSIIEKMEQAIAWEKRVLSKICISDEKWLNGRIGGDVTPIANKKIARIRYNVDNVFQSEEIKQKIKKTNLQKYGVEHPSHSQELLEKKKLNNIKKYGVSCNLNLPHVVEKAQNSIKTELVKNKRKNTNLQKYGVEYVSQTHQVKQKVTEAKDKQINRGIILYIKEYQRVFHITLTSGWYQKSDENLNTLLNEIQLKCGVYSYDELSKIEIPKKYSGSIKKLQERYIVKQIKKYKQKYGRSLKLGRCWDRKSESYLNNLYLELQKEYGII
jgi:hypothetical protein